MPRLVFLTVALLAIISPLQPVSAQETQRSDMDQGIIAYRSRDYKGALDHFEAALPNEFSNPNLHYYIANCMVFLKHNEAAIKEYRIGYALDPQGSAGGYCKTCLTNLGVDVGGPAAGKTQTAPALSDHEKVLQELKELAGKLGSSPTSAFDTSDLKLSVPRMRPPVQEAQDAHTILTTWSRDSQAYYVQQATDRRERALQAYNDAQQAMGKAEQAAAALLPSSRSYGETDDQFRQRRAAYQGKITELLAPYKQDVETTRRVYSDETALYQACIVAAHVRY